MSQPDIAPIGTKVTQVSADRESLPMRYAELLDRNPLLGRIQGQCKVIGWTDEEIRTVQLLTAVASNASLQSRIKELEDSVMQMTEESAEWSRRAAS